MGSLSVTIDSSVLIDWLDKRQPTFDFVEQIMKWHKLEYIKVFTSSRVFSPDAWRMDKEQRAGLKQLLNDLKVTTASSTFRWSISILNGPDKLSGGNSQRSLEETKLFLKIVGSSPEPSSELERSFLRKLGDYDALRDHFMSGRDIFITRDTKGYFATDKRTRYEKELGLIVQGPEGFVSSFSRTLEGACV